MQLWRTQDRGNQYVIESTPQVEELKNSEMVAKEFGQDDSIPNRTLRISIHYRED